MPWVTWIDIENKSTAGAEVKELYARHRHPITKETPDLVRLASQTPEVAGLMQNLNQAIHRDATGLTIREQEIAALIVSAYNGCVH